MRGVGQEEIKCVWNGCNLSFYIGPHASDRNDKSEKLIQIVLGGFRLSFIGFSGTLWNIAKNSVRFSRMAYSSFLEFKYNFRFMV